jgi:hypothetical protein
MDNNQKIIVALLIAAVLFSVASIAFNLTVVGLEPLEFVSADGAGSFSDSSDGNVRLSVMPSGGQE